jgi:hypothetical protein
MGLIDRLTESARLALKHRDSIGQLLHDNFSKDALAHIRERRLLVSEDAIRMEVERIEGARPWLKSIRCEPDGVLLELEGLRFGGTISVRLHVRVEKLVLTVEEQSLVLRVVEETVLGRDLLGKILCGFGSVMLRSFTGYAIEQSQLRRYAEFDEPKHQMTIRLGELEIVRQMLEPRIPDWPASVPLGFLGIDGCDHVSAGVLLRLRTLQPIEQWWKRAHST